MPSCKPLPYDSQLATNLSTHTPPRNHVNPPSAEGSHAKLPTDILLIVQDHLTATQIPHRTDSWFISSQTWSVVIPVAGERVGESRTGCIGIV